MKLMVYLPAFATHDVFLFVYFQFLSMKLASVNPMFYDFGMDLDALMGRPEVIKKKKKLKIFL